MLITVFTPTYNRAYILPKLFDSLQKQTFHDFEWLVVDDGSTDDTETMVSHFAEEASFPLRYIKTENGGKHRAVNKGVQLARGELFFIVDSDDWLTDNAIEEITLQYSRITDKGDFCGVCGLISYPNGEKVGGECDFNVLDCSALDFRYKHNIQGDMAEVFRTDILRQYPFPEFDGEKFCPEALVWNRIALKYKLRYFYQKIYVCEYLPDGLTASSVNVRRNSPQASSTYYSELYHLKITFKVTIKAAINFWRFALANKSSKYRMNGLLPLLCRPLGSLMRKKDSCQLIK